MIAIACDHSALDMKKVIIELLDQMGLPYHDYGTYTADSCDYPVFAARAAGAVARGECEKGILICGTGIGMSIAANKVDGIRCALCSEPYSAKLTRMHNDSNVLALGASLRNIAFLKNAKHIYFVPLGQDDTDNKPNSLVADFGRIEDTITAALAGTQIQPLFL